MNYSLHPEASEDLRDAASFYREQAGTSLSQSFFGEFEQSINRLLQHPALGSSWRGRGRRRYVMKHFPLIGRRLRGIVGRALRRRRYLVRIGSVIIDLLELSLKSRIVLIHNLQTAGEVRSDCVFACPVFCDSSDATLFPV